MTIDEQLEQAKAKRFIISPDKKLARWVHPLEIERFYLGWHDHTDTTEKEFIEFLSENVSSLVDVPSESQ